MHTMQATAMHQATATHLAHTNNTMQATARKSMGPSVLPTGRHGGALWMPLLQAITTSSQQPLMRRQWLRGPPADPDQVPILTGCLSLLAGGKIGVVMQAATRIHSRT